MSDDRLNVSTTCLALDDLAASGGNPEEILDSCLELVAQQMDSERAFIMLYDSNFDELNVFAVRHIDPNTLFTTAEVSQTIINSVYEEEKPILSTNAIDDPRFAERSSVVISGLRSVICVPIMVAEGLVGILYMDNRLKVGAFQQKHLDFLNMCMQKLAQIIMKIFPDTQAKRRKREPFNQ